MDNFEQFKARRELWIQSLNGEDKNSIMKQIYHMIWNAAVFKIVNESIKLVPVDKNGVKQLNGMVFNLLDNCFFESQFITIRRLTDIYPLEGDKSVFSLMPLLKDMKNNINLLTRSNYFKAEGLEYDYEIVRKKNMEYEQNQIKGKTGVVEYWVPDELDYGRIIERHREFDILTEKSEKNRNPNDRVCVKVFDCLIKKLIDATKNVKIQVEKYIAHAATPGSREVANADEVVVTLGYIWNAHKVICQVANFLDTYLLSRASHRFLPISQYNNFEFIDKTLIDREKIKDLQDVWGRYEKETETWGGWGLEEFQKEQDKNN